MAAECGALVLGGISEWLLPNRERPSARRAGFARGGRASEPLWPAAGSPAAMSSKPKDAKKKVPQLAGPGASLRRCARDAGGSAPRRRRQLGARLAHGRSGRGGVRGAGTAQRALAARQRRGARALIAALRLAGPSVRPGGVMVPPEGKNGPEPPQEDKGIMDLIAGLSPWAEVRPVAARPAARCAAGGLLRPSARVLRRLRARARRPGVCAH